MTAHKIDRRRLMQCGLLGAGALLTGCHTFPKGSVDTPIIWPPYHNRLGVQLYTVRDLFEPDFRGTLDALAAIGYVDLETAGLFAHDPREVRAHMDSLGLMSRSAHVPIDAVEPRLPVLIETADILGQRNLIVPFVNQTWRSPDGYRRLADSLNAAGEEAAKAGKQIAYHNHAFEFETLANGEVGYDILLERTDPALVAFEADLFWIVEAGLDPVSLFERAPGRFIACHIKDRNAQGEMVPVGDGTISFRTILSYADVAGLDYFYVEHDKPANSLDSVTRSYRALNPV